ncbi:MAG TPA: protease SohB [Gammaproteobacteria bacterium]|nr:protease SohB [Gammaproteobacteria bacterium]
MSEFLSSYGLFLVELATVAALVLVVAVLIVSSRRGGHGEGLTVEHLNRRYEDAADAVKRAIAGKSGFKKQAKARQKDRKRAAKERAKEQTARPRLFVLDFKGDLRASASASLREEVSAVLDVAADHDQVLLRLENPGGAVHEHGFAASQLLRIKRRGLKLLIAIDKVAASGGYLMACVGDHLIAAPFAVVGSIGVVAQLPNFHRLLEEKGVDYEMLTAGRFKRTLSMFGKNTDEGRDKLQQEIDEVHELFKSQIREHRPQVDLDKVATGEHWYGIRALELKLVDELRTSDDFLREAAKERDVYAVSYKRRRSLPERMLSGAETLLSR